MRGRHATRFDLTGSEPTRTQTLKPILPEGDKVTAMRLAAKLAALALSPLDSLGHHRHDVAIPFRSTAYRNNRQSRLF